MITNPSLPPLDRLAELADYFRTAEVSADVLVLSKADVAEFRAVCEAASVPQKRQWDEDNPRCSCNSDY